MSDGLPYPLSDALKSAQWRVNSYAAKIMRQDDPIKMRRLIREYRKATESLLAAALAARDERQQTADTRRERP